MIRGVVPSPPLLDFSNFEHAQQDLENIKKGNKEFTEEKMKTFSVSFCVCSFFVYYSFFPFFSLFMVSVSVSVSFFLLYLCVFLSGFFL